jgi:hypothetical protein
MMVTKTLFVFKVYESEAIVHAKTKNETLVGQGSMKGLMRDYAKPKVFFVQEHITICWFCSQHGMK